MTRPCWNCFAGLSASAVDCGACGESVRFGSSPSLINAAEVLVHKFNGVLAHLESSAKKYGAASLEAKVWATRRAEVRLLMESIGQMREALRADGLKKSAA